MRGLAHFTFRRDREGDAPAEPLSYRPPMPPRQGSAGASPSPRLALPTASAHCPPPLPLLPLVLATRNPLLTIAFLSVSHPSAPSAHRNPLAKPHAIPPIFPGSDADFRKPPKHAKQAPFCRHAPHENTEFPSLRLKTRHAKLAALCPFERDRATAHNQDRNDATESQKNLAMIPIPSPILRALRASVVNPTTGTSPIFAIEPSMPVGNPSIREPAETRNGAGHVEIIVLAALVAALFVPVPGRLAPPWIGSLEDLAHAPLFAVVAWALRRLMGGRTVLAAVMALSLAAVVEPLQSYVGRSQSMDDFVHGACGIAIFLGWTLAARIATTWRRRAVRLACLAIGAALPLADAWPTLADGWASWREFPVLADFSSPWEDRRWSVQDCRLSCEPGPRAEGDGVLQCEAGGPPHPSITLFPIRRDWSPLSSLQVEFTVEGGPLPMTLSVRDGRRVTPPQRRFDRREVYQDGRHRVGVDLHELARGAGEVAPVDVGAVQSFHLIIDADGVGRVVRLHRIWLE